MGATTIEVAEIWAVGARADAEVYAEMRERLAASPPEHATVALSEAIELLGRAAGHLIADEGSSHGARSLLARRTLARPGGADQRRDRDPDARAGDADLGTLAHRALTASPRVRPPLAAAASSRSQRG